MDKKSYLPSKDFIIRVVFIVGVLLIGFALYKGIPAIVKGFKNANKKAEMKKVLVKDLVEKDSNDNGIADWEESLWGLDPTKDGESNKQLIITKRTALGYSGEGNDSGEITPTDQMSRELLALIVTLRDSGNLNDESMANISNAIGEKISIKEIPDIYSRDSLTIVDTNVSSIRKYYNDLKALNSVYEGGDIGDELTFISQGIQNSDPKALEIAQSVAELYRQFAKDLMEIKTPLSVVTTHISLANNYEKVAQMIEEMELSLTDQISGMNGVLGYRQYSEDLSSDWDELQLFFKRNGIIK
jgi:hypothetical protein